MRRAVYLAASFSLAACNSTSTDNSFLITPTAATATAGKTLQIDAAAKGGVTFAVQEPAGGTVNANGLYTAPAPAGTYHVVATSVNNARLSGTAAVTVVPRPRSRSSPRRA